MEYIDGSNATTKKHIVASTVAGAAEKSYLIWFMLDGMIKANKNVGWPSLVDDRESPS
jgi:hypothetical protein